MRRALITTCFTAALLAAGTGTANATILTPNGNVVFPTTKAGSTSQMTFTLSREESDGVAFASNVQFDFTEFEDDSAFTQTNNCPFQLTVVQPSCTITVTFVPGPRLTKAFTYTGRLQAGDQIGDSTAALSARGVPKAKKCKKGKRKKSATTAAKKKSCKGKKK